MYMKCYVCSVNTNWRQEREEAHLPIRTSSRGAACRVHQW